MICTTLRRIESCDPCLTGWRKLLRHLGKTEADDSPLPFSVILESNGLNDALWATRSAPEYSREWRLFAVWCARQVQHLMSGQRSAHAIDVAERHANGDATDEELAAAWTSAWTSAWTAASSEAWAARHSAVAAAGDADWAAQDAASAASWAAASDAAWAAASAEAWDAAMAAARDAQATRFLEVVGAEATQP